MKEFWVYTILRLGLFAGTAAIAAGVWQLATGAVPWLWVLVVAFALSGIASFVLLDKQRSAFARRVEVRAARTVEAFEERRAREDAE